MTTIMVIEDEPTIRELVVVVLIEEGYDVIEAPNGHRALELLDEATPDIIVTDLMMPGIDGYETIRRMRDIHGLNDVPVVIMSAAGQARGLRAGMTTFLRKPFDINDLIASISSVAPRSC